MAAEPAREARAVARKRLAHVIANKSYTYYAGGTQVRRPGFRYTILERYDKRAAPVDPFGPTR